MAWVDATEKPVAEILPQKPINYPSGIIINEILPSPEGPDAQEEWIELYNQNSSSVSLADWQLKDFIGTINVFNFPSSYHIPAEGFLVLSRETTKLILNNDGDSLLLIRPDGEMVNQIAFQDAERGKSYGRTKENGWEWTSFLTPGAENVFEDVTAQTIEEQSDSTQTKESDLEKQQDLNNKELATINESASSKLSFLLIAFSISLFSGVFILILKKKN